MTAPDPSMPLGPTEYIAFGGTVLAAVMANYGYHLNVPVFDQQVSAVAQYAGPLVIAVHRFLKRRTLVNVVAVQETVVPEVKAVAAVVGTVEGSIPRLASQTLY